MQATYKLYFFIGRTSTFNSRNITSHNLSLACKQTFVLLLSLRTRARILVAWEEVHEWPMGARASELFGRNSSPNKSGKCTTTKRMIFSYESVAISKKHTFRLWSRITASEWKRTTTLAILIHRSGWHIPCPLGGVIPKSGSVTIYLLPVASY